MTTIISILIFLLLMPFKVSAEEWDIPAPPSEVQEYMPDTSASFGEAFWKILNTILPKLRPDLDEAIKIGGSLFAVAILLALLPDGDERIRSTANLAGTVFATLTFFSSSRSLINLGCLAIQELSEYSKLFFPVISVAMAANGSFSSSATFYLGATIFGTFLGNILKNIGVPLVNIFLVVAAVCSTNVGESLKRGKEYIKKSIGWFLKTILSFYISYMGISGIVSGTTDAAKLKATKTAISTVVPVLGTTLSNAAEAIFVGADIAKNAVGIYGIYAMMAIFLAPFLKIGTHYLILKCAEFLCGILGTNIYSDLIADFATAMGLLLAMTGSLCLIHLISTICFIKGGGI